MSGTVVVVGAGVAGTAAALAAASAGARVTVVDGGSGASMLWTGAVDAGGGAAGGTAVVQGGLAPSGGSVPPPASERAREIARALGVVLDACVVVPTTGWLRAAGGRDAAILDVRPLLERGEVGVVRADRPAWDADAIARAGGGGLFAIDATVLRMSDERVLPDADFAARHDDPARLDWLSDRLREALAMAHRPLRGLLLPPSLGIGQARAGELSELVGLPCGEATGMPGGPAGLRFERARDGALLAAAVDVVAGRAIAVASNGARWRVRLAGSAGAGPDETGIDGRTIEADAVVIAAGGLIGGGLEYQPSEAMPAAAMPPGARPAFRCTIGAPVRVGVHGKPLGVPGSLFGVAPESIAWPLARGRARDAMTERVGLLCDAEGRATPGGGSAAGSVPPLSGAAPRLYAAGEIVADAKRTWLAALESGIVAGSAAARDVVKAPAARPSSPAEAPASRP